MKKKVEDELNIPPILSKILEIAQAASAIILSNYGSALEVTFKEVESILTNIDLEVEKLTYSSLNKNFEDFHLISEEDAPQNTIPQDDKLCFILDPLDGTSNYVHNIPYFSFSLGVTKSGKFLAGVVSNPLTDEYYFGSSEIIENSEGHQEKFGSYYLNYRGILRKLETFQLTQSVFRKNPTINTSHSYLRRFGDLIPKNYRARVMGSLALGMSETLAGKFDGFLTNSSKLWDIAASLCIAEASDIPYLWKLTNQDQYEVVIGSDLIDKINSF